MERHPHIPESVWRFLKKLARHKGVEALILFGSRAYGDHDTRSDVDVAVCGESISRLEWARMRNAAFTAESLFWISLVHLDTNPAALRQRIIDTGKLIYVRKKTSR
jgi:uncharacterized protein